jgi:hypothetical protein
VFIETRATADTDTMMWSNLLRKCHLTAKHFMLLSCLLKRMSNIRQLSRLGRGRELEGIFKKVRKTVFQGREGGISINSPGHFFLSTICPQKLRLFKSTKYFIKVSR